MPLSAEQLSKLDALYRKSTPGPWLHDPDTRIDGASQVLQARDTNLAVCFMATGQDKDEHEATAELIAFQRNHAEAVLALVRACERMIANPTWGALCDEDIDVERALTALDAAQKERG